MNKTNLLYFIKFLGNILNKTHLDKYQAIILTRIKRKNRKYLESDPDIVNAENPI